MIQVLGTSTDSSFSKVCDITIPAQYHGTYADLVEEYCMANMELLEDLVRTGTVPTALSTNLFNDAPFGETFQPHFGDEFILWPDPAYTSDLD